MKLPRSRLSTLGAILVLPSFLACSSSPVSRPCTQAAMTPPTQSAGTAADPTTTDPDKYKSIIENDRVRVLRYHDEPGAKTHQHRHPASVLYALSSFRRKLSFPDGTMREREFKAGDVMWLPAQTHIGENIGTTDTEVLLVETKER